MCLLEHHSSGGHSVPFPLWPPRRPATLETLIVYCDHFKYSPQSVHPPITPNFACSTTTTTGPHGPAHKLAGSIAAKDTHQIDFIDSVLVLVLFGGDACVPCVFPSSQECLSQLLLHSKTHSARQAGKQARALVRPAN